MSVINELKLGIYNSNGKKIKNIKIDPTTINQQHILIIQRGNYDKKWNGLSNEAKKALNEKSRRLRNSYLQQFFNNNKKEISEEANLSVKTKLLYALIHKARHEYEADARDFYKFYFLCEQTDAADPKPGAEALAAEFFHLDQLPPLSTGRSIEKHIKLAVAYKQDPTLNPYFD